MHKIKYPPDAALLSAKVYNFKLCTRLKFKILSHIISLWAGEPPGLSITIARADVFLTFIFSKFFDNSKELKFLHKLLLFFHDRSFIVEEILMTAIVFKENSWKIFDMKFISCWFSKKKKFFNKFTDFCVKKKKQSWKKKKNQKILNCIKF